MIHKIRLIGIGVITPLFLTCCNGYFNECYFYLPKNFNKDIIIHFGIDGGTDIVKLDNGDYHIIVDSSGHVYTRIEYEEYFDYQGEFFQWDGDERLCSFEELKTKGIVNAAGSMSSPLWNDKVVYDRYIIYFNASKYQRPF